MIELTVWCVSNDKDLSNVSPFLKLDQAADVELSFVLFQVEYSGACIDTSVLSLSERQISEIVI